MKGAGIKKGSRMKRCGDLVTNEKELIAPAVNGNGYRNDEADGDDDDDDDDDGAGLDQSKGLPFCCFYPIQ